MTPNSGEKIIAVIMVAAIVLISCLVLKKLWSLTTPNTYGSKKPNGNSGQNEPWYGGGLTKLKSGKVVLGLLAVIGLVGLGWWLYQVNFGNPTAGDEKVIVRTIVAPVGEFSQEPLEFPPNSSGEIRDTSGHIKVLTASGKSWETYPGKRKPVHLSNDPKDRQWYFLSMDGKPATVTISYQLTVR